MDAVKRLRTYKRMLVLMKKADKNPHVLDVFSQIQCDRSVKYIYYGFCYYLSECVGWEPSIYEFPELIEYQPKKKYYFGFREYWWSPISKRSHRKRIQILEEIIKNLSKKVG